MAGIMRTDDTEFINSVRIKYFIDRSGIVKKNICVNGFKPMFVIVYDSRLKNNFVIQSHWFRLSEKRYVGIFTSLC